MYKQLQAARRTLRKLAARNIHSTSVADRVLQLEHAARTRALAAAHVKHCNACDYSYATPTCPAC